jgi:hypothetical protein
MAVSQNVIDAYLRLYTREQIESALREALADRASGVQVTQASFQDGGGSGVVIPGDPNEVIVILELCLKTLDSQMTGGVTGGGISSRVNFRFRRTET